MILTFDVGNTETKAALFDGDDLRAHWRVPTGDLETADGIVPLLRSFFDSRQIRFADVKGSAVCSVVPRVTEPIAQACRKCFGTDAAIIDARAGLPIELRVDEPAAVGADRIANVLAAHRMWHHNAIVIDLGTATTYDCVTADGAFIGGIIQPGVQTSADTLFRKTSLLPRTDLVAPKAVIGTRTDECIRSGVLYGAAESIDGLVRRIRKEWGEKGILVVATGGLAGVMRPHVESFDEVDSFLTLKGVRLGYEALRGNNRP